MVTLTNEDSSCKVLYCILLKEGCMPLLASILLHVFRA